MFHQHKLADLKILAQIVSLVGYVAGLDHGSKFVSETQDVF